MIQHRSLKYDCSLLEDDVIIVRPEDVVKAGLAAAGLPEGTP